MIIIKVPCHLSSYTASMRVDSEMRTIRRNEKLMRLYEERKRMKQM